MADEPLADLVDPLDAQREEDANHIPSARDLETYDVLAPEDDGPRTLRPRSATGRWVPRSEWGARAPKSRVALRSPRGNTAHYEGPAMGNYSHDTCAAKVRSIQRFHMDTRGWSDVAYSTIICRHGYIYECRGYGVRTAANGTDAGNDASFAHCVMIGTGDSFPDEAQAGLREAFLVYEGKGSGTIRWTHEQWKATQCPGEPVRAYVRAGIPSPGPAPQPEPSPTPPADDDEFRRKVMALPTLTEGAGVAERAHQAHYVRILQALLVAHAEDLTRDANAFVDGQLGSGTVTVLRTWQQRTGRLNPDGVCGPATWAWLVGV